MRIIRNGEKTVYAMKVVYVGPAEAGKTTNVSEISKMYAAKYISFESQSQRTVYADITVPKQFDKGDTILNVTTYSVPGQDRFRPMREVIINRADVLIFVADSAPMKMSLNMAALEDIKDIVTSYYQRDFMKDLTISFQYNKRDLEIKLDTGSLSSRLNHFRAPEFEAVATKGIGVVESFVESVNLFLSQHDVPGSCRLSSTDFETQSMPYDIFSRRRELRETNY